MSRERKVPIRTCIACRETSEKRTLVRIVRTPTGEVRLDSSGKMAGRGAYLCDRKECLTQAIKHKKLDRALKCEIPSSVLRELENIVVKDDAK